MSRKKWIRKLRKLYKNRCKETIQGVKEAMGSVNSWDNWMGYYQEGMSPEEVTSEYPYYGKDCIDDIQ